MTDNSLRLHVKMENLGKDFARSVCESKDQNQRICSKDSSGRELLVWECETENTERLAKKLQRFLTKRIRKGGLKNSRL